MNTPAENIIEGPEAKILETDKDDILASDKVKTKKSQIQKQVLNLL